MPFAFYEKKGDRMTATEELRCMLYKLGVEWHKPPRYSSEPPDNETVFKGNGIEWYAHDHLNGRLGLRAAKYEITPDLVVAATLDRGTCRDVAIEGEWFECCECRTVKRLIRPNFCPICGRRVVQCWRS